MIKHKDVHKNKTITYGNNNERTVIKLDYTPPPVDEIFLTEREFQAAAANPNMRI